MKLLSKTGARVLGQLRSKQMDILDVPTHTLCSLIVKGYAKINRSSGAPMLEITPSGKYAYTAHRSLVQIDWKKALHNTATTKRRAK